MRRRIPWWILAVLFVALPIFEIYLIIQLGKAVGPWWTILILIADAIFGAWLVRHEGSRAWSALQETLTSGRMPAKELADGALILVGGTLLITPGFVTDVVGLFCILPFTRPLARRMLTRVLARRLIVVPAGGTWPGNAGPGQTRPGPRDPRPGGTPSSKPGSTQGDVVTGEVVDDDPPGTR